MNGSMPQLMLQFMYVHARFKLVSCIGVAQGMDATDFLNTGFFLGGSEYALHGATG